MNATLTPSRNGGTHASPARRWGDSGKIDPAAVDAMLELGLHTPKAAEHAIAQAFNRAAIAAKHLLRQGATVRLANLMAPLDAEIARAAADVCKSSEVEVVRQESEADQAEQVAQDVLAVAPSREHAIDFLRRSRTARAAALRLEWLVAAKWQVAL